jgi:hypothetical protein
MMLIAALLISFSYSYAVVNDNLTVNKTGTGSFSASIIIPLKIYNAEPSPVGPREFVRGASYDMTTSCQYTIHGQLYKNVFVKVYGTVSGTGKQIKDDGAGVKLYISWFYDDSGDLVEYTGSSSTPYPLTPKSGETFGKAVIWSYYTKLEIASDATPGEHEFIQTVEVSYNPGF